MTLKLKNRNFIKIKSLFCSVNNIDINKIIVCNKLPLGKQDFRYFTGYKDHKKN